MRRKGRRIRRRQRKRQRRWRKREQEEEEEGEEEMVSWKKFNDWFLIKAVDRLGKIRAMAHCPGESNQAPQSAEDVLHSTVVPEVTSLTSEYSQESWI